MNRFRLLLSLALLASGGLVAFVACAPPPAKKAPLKTAPDKPADDDEADDDDAAKKPPIVVKPETDPPLPDGGQAPGKIYAHTPDALYLFDPIGKTLKKIGDFKGLDPGEVVIDIALDHDSTIYGTTFQAGGTTSAFIKIDPIDAKVTYLKRETTIVYPNSLAFMPGGTVDPTKEALVGYGPPTGAGKDYIRIDTASGERRIVGAINDPAAATQYVSAGDIISMERNGKAYAVFKKQDGGTENDQLAEIDPVTGKIKTLLGDVGSNNTYGLAQWAGTAYTFNAQGEITEVSLTGGAGKKIMTLTIDGGPGQWYGAGVTTDAPTKPN